MRLRNKSGNAVLTAQFPISPISNTLGKRKRADSDSDSDSAYTARTSLSSDQPVFKRISKSTPELELKQSIAEVSAHSTRSSRKKFFESGPSRVTRSFAPTPSPTPSVRSFKHNTPPSHYHEKRSAAPKSNETIISNDAPQAKLSSNVRKIFRSTALRQPAWLTSEGFYPGFELFDKPEEQIGVDKCPKGCDCSSDACPCRRNQTTCDLGCRCSDKCKRRFPSCQCKGACGHNCVCNYHGRDCGKDCQCTTCGNVAADGKPPKFRIQPSGIQGAGEGLFAAEFIKAGAFMGCYEGNTVENSNERTPQVIMDFEVSKDLCIRPDPDTCMLFKVNHWRQRANMQFIVKESLLGRKVYAFAKRDIAPGHEIFADYRTSPEFNSPMPESRSLARMEDFTVEVRKNNLSYTIEPLDEWQRLEQVFSVKVSGDQFHVGDDVFVNYFNSPPIPLPDTAKAHQVLRQRMRHCWVGRIMEIRQRPDNPNKRYAVIAWYDKPSISEPRSRKNTNSSFDKFEMVGTRNVEVQDFDTISGRADIEYVAPRAAPRQKKLFYRGIWDDSRGVLADPTDDEEVFLNVDPFKQRASKQRL